MAGTTGSIVSLSLTPPFCTSAEVAAFHHQLLKGGSDFVDGTTIPSKTQVEMYINLASSQIISRFRLAGYLIPLTTSLDDWLEEEVNFVKFACIMGASNLLSSPAVSNPGVRGRDRTPFEIQYNELLDTIYNRSTKIAIPFSATYKSASPADEANNSGTPLNEYLSNELARPDKLMVSSTLADYLWQDQSYTLSNAINRSDYQDYR